jgi:cytochrome c biogenesis protein CcdA
MGLMFGVRHALEPDHLAAVGTFVPKHATPRGAAYIGALWGAGHATAVLILGSALLSLQFNLPDWVDRRLEQFVGIVLVGLGSRAMLHGMKVNQAPADSLDAHHAHWHPFAVGLTHGVAGTGAVSLLAIAIDGSIWSGLFFLLVFGVGSALGMSMIAGVFALPLQRVEVLNRYKGFVHMGSGALSIAIGIWWFLKAAL